MKEKILYIKAFALIIVLLLEFKINPKIFFFTYLENQIKFKHIDLYSKHCNDQQTLIEFKKIIEPKISIKICNYS